MTKAEVTVGDELIGRIGHGLLVLLGAAKDDTDSDAKTIVDKLVGLRIFADDEGHMNRSVAEVAGSMLLVSQFTLLGDARKGRRPSFIDAMAPELAQALYDRTVAYARETGIPVETGRFRADMQVALVNDGPVTILLDSKKLF